MHTHTRAYAHTRTHNLSHAHTHTHMNTHTHRETCVCVCVCVCVFIFSYIYTAMCCRFYCGSYNEYAGPAYVCTRRHILPIHSRLVAAFPAATANPMSYNRGLKQTRNCSSRYSKLVMQTLHQMCFLFVFQIQLIHTVYLVLAAWYGVATISRLLNVKGLFCKRAL